VLEVRHRQAQQVAQHIRGEHRVDPVPGVDHEILAKPCQGGVEDQEDREADTDDDQRAAGLVHHDLVDDHLREKRGGEADKLDRERCDEDIAPDRAMLEQLGDEPAEAKRLLLRRKAGHLVIARLWRSEQDGDAFEACVELGERLRLRYFAARIEVEDALRIPPDEQRRHDTITRATKTNRGKRQGAELRRARRRLAGLEAARAKRVEEDYAVIRRRKLSEDERRIEWKARKSMQARKYPHERLAGDLRRLQCRCAVHRPPEDVGQFDKRLFLLP
jgi:hypothetical protein